MWQRFSPMSRRVLLQAQQEALQDRKSHVETEHLLLSLLREEHCRAGQLVRELGVTGQKVHAELRGEEQSQPDKDLLLAHFERMSARIHVDVDSALIRRVEKQLHRKMREQSDKPELVLSEQLKRALKRAAGESNQSAGVIETRHLLLGLLREPDNRAAQALQEMGLELKLLRLRLMELNPGDDE